MEGTDFVIPTARKTICSFSKCSEKMVFPKKLQWNIIFLVVLSRKLIYFFFPEIWYYSFDGKWKMIFLRKNTWKYDIFFKFPEKMAFPKKITLEFDFPCIIWKDSLFFSGKYDIFFLDKKWKMIFLKKYMEIWNVSIIFCIYLRMLQIWYYPSAKKIKDDFLPKKYT